MQSKASLESDSQPVEPSLLEANGTAQAAKQAAPAIKKGVHLLMWRLLDSLLYKQCQGNLFAYGVAPSYSFGYVHVHALKLLVIDHCANSVSSLLCSKKQEAEALTARRTTS